MKEVPMIKGKKGKKYEENKLGEMLVLLGGSIEYKKQKGNLDGYEIEYARRRMQRGFYYNNQRKGDKIIRLELRKQNIFCPKKRTKRLYRYLIHSNKIDNMLYLYFEKLVSHIWAEKQLVPIVMTYIVKPCECELENQFFNKCLDNILGGQYRRLVYEKTKQRTESKHIGLKAKRLLEKLKTSKWLDKFQSECQKINGAFL